MAAASGRHAGALRRHNLALILRSVHAEPMTRSGLTRVSGLNRSTVGVLVADLVARGLAIEDEASAAGGIGRPSPVVRPGEAPVAVAVSPESDVVTIGLVGLGGRVLASERCPFAQPPTPAEAVEATVRTAGRLLAGVPERQPVGVGVAVPGMVGGGGVVRLAPHLGWREVPLCTMLEDGLGLPVTAANDGMLGARAEHLFGAGRDADDLVYLHGGASGIGGGIVTGGVLVAGAAGHAGEFGHAAVRRGGASDTIGVQGTLEAEVTRAGLLEALGVEQADPDELEALLVASDRPEVAAEVRRQSDALAVAIANAATVLNPSCVVLGGFLAALATAAGDRLPRAVEARGLPLPGERVAIRGSELGSRLLLIGAAELAFAAVLDDPSAFRR